MRAFDKRKSTRLAWKTHVRAGKVASPSSGQWETGVTGRMAEMLRAGHRCGIRTKKVRPAQSGHQED